MTREFTKEIANILVANLNGCSWLNQYFPLLYNVNISKLSKKYFPFSLHPLDIAAVSNLLNTTLIFEAGLLIFLPAVSCGNTTFH